LKDIEKPMVYLREINNILILLDVVYTFVHSKRRGKTMGFPAASLNVQSNCHFVTDKNTFISEKSPIRRFQVIYRHFKSAKV
jgi:hypothetical protein